MCCLHFARATLTYYLASVDESDSRGGGIFIRGQTSGGPLQAVVNITSTLFQSNSLFKSAATAEATGGGASVKNILQLGIYDCIFAGNSLVLGGKCMLLNMQIDLIHEQFSTKMYPIIWRWTLFGGCDGHKYLRLIL